MKSIVNMEFKGSKMVCPACGLDIQMPQVLDLLETIKERMGNVKLVMNCPNWCEQEITYYPNHED